MDTHGDEFNSIHIATAFCGLGKQSAQVRHAYNQAGLARLLRRTCAMLPECEARNLANIAHGVAKGRVGCVGLNWTEERAATDPASWDSLTWDSPGWSVAATTAEQGSTSGGSYSIPTSEAFLKTRHLTTALLDSVATAALVRMRGFNPQVPCVHLLSR